MSQNLMIDERIKEVANRIKSVREDLGFTVEQMAKKTGTTPEEYRLLESGQSDFNFTFIYKFANACSLDITDIMEGTSPLLTQYSVVRKGEGMPFARREGFKYYNLAPAFKNKLAEPFYVVIPYSEQAQNEPMHLSTHTGHEIDIVLKGSMKIQVGDRYEILHEGDSIYYDSSIPHDERAIGGSDCEIYAIVINPDTNGMANYEEKVIAATTTNTDLANLENPVYEKFITTETDDKGVLSGISFKNEDKFNFAFDIVDGLAQKCPDKTAMVHLTNKKQERVFTYKDMMEYSNMTANYFESLGIKKGDRVMLVLKRHYQFWFSMLALHKIGAIAIPATNLLKEHDFEYRFNAAGVKAIICTSDGETADEADKAAPQSPSLAIKVSVNGKREGWHCFEEEFEAFSKEYTRTEESPCGSDPLLMFFTSGTTGNPKIAEHNHKYPLGHFITAKYWHNVDPNGMHFTISDTGWGKALWGKLYGQWLCETAVFTYDFDRFDADDILPLFKQYGITTFCAPPTMYRFFIRQDLSKYDLSSVKYATVAGEALNPEVYHQFLKATGISLMEGYGQTETTLTIGNFVGTEVKVGSMGKPSPLYDIEIMDKDGNPCKAGDIGEICIKTDKGNPCGLYMGYYLDDDLTQKVWHDGYYHTGDTAWKDTDGNFWFVGRVDDVIKSSGYRIGPFEIESVIMELPYVLECAVTAAPDEIRGQVVKATIILTQGTKESDALKKEIQEYVKKRTAPYKYPRIVNFVDSLPKTISGKIIRAKIK